MAIEEKAEGLLKKLFKNPVLTLAVGFAVGIVLMVLLNHGA